jgi:hypothetical protein
VNKPNNLLAKAIIILAASVPGALLMTGLDLGGARLLKFALYMIFFAAIFSMMFFSSRFSCRLPFSRSRR